MIRSLRHRHRTLFIGLAVAIPLLYAAALLSRPPLAISEQAPAPLVLAERPPATPVATLSLGEWAGVELFAGDPDALYLRLADRRPPDLLLYLSSESGGEGGELPADALLLGAADRDGLRFALPEGSDRRRRLLLYSLGHRRLLAQATLPSVDGASEER